MEVKENFLRILGVGRRPIDDPFFDNAYNNCRVFQRTGVIIEDEEELCHEVMREFTCNACNAKFQNLLDYELHYHDNHHFVCGECKKSRSTARLLEIHLQETHDSFFKVLAEKQPMYQCFVSECDVKFKDPIERREHCINIHKFPKNYRFDDSTNQKKVLVENVPMETDDINSHKVKASKIHFGASVKQKAFTKKNYLQPNNDSNINICKNEMKMSPVTMFIPRQVQQKSYAKSLTKQQKMEKNVLESETMMELSEALPNT